MFTTILEETQPCFVECGTALVKEYPMALYQDDKNVYHVVGPKESIISSWKFIARFQSKHNATLYGRYLTHQKEQHHKHHYPIFRLSFFILHYLFFFLSNITLVPNIKYKTIAINII